jgi:hypothetical protein
MKTSGLNDEHYEQTMFVQWFRRSYPTIRIFAIPLGGHRHPAVAAKLRCEGVSAGIPDLFIPAWSTWVEMKRAKGGRLSEVQKDWIAYLESIGHKVLVGHGFEDAMAKVQQLGFVPIK